MPAQLLMSLVAFIPMIFLSSNDGRCRYVPQMGRCMLLYGIVSSSVALMSLAESKSQKVALPPFRPTVAQHFCRSFWQL